MNRSRNLQEKGALGVSPTLAWPPYDHQYVSHSTFAFLKSFSRPTSMEEGLVWLSCWKYWSCCCKPYGCSQSENASRWCSPRHLPTIPEHPSRIYSHLSPRGLTWRALQGMGQLMDFPFLRFVLSVRSSYLVSVLLVRGLALVGVWLCVLPPGGDTAELSCQGRCSHGTKSRDPLCCNDARI